MEDTVDGDEDLDLWSDYPCLNMNHAIYYLGIEERYLKCTAD